MAGEDKDQRTEQPTPKRLQDAKVKGQVVQSKEVSNFFALFAAFAYVVLIFPFVAKKFIIWAQAVLEQPLVFEVLFETFLIDVFSWFILTLILFIIAAFISHYIQHGWVFSNHGIIPKFNKISPIAGFKRMFSLNSLVELAKSMVKLTLVVTLSYKLLADDVERIFDQVHLSFYDTLQLLFILVIKLIAGVLGLTLILAVIDYQWQKFQYLKRLRMTKQEVKDEHKQTDGDPHVKARIRRIRVQRARNRMMAQVPTADVIITNPTHYAVALSYVQQDMKAPKLVAKGVDVLAARMRTLATEHHIPIVENPPLARALYLVELNEEIPVEHYQAVAEIIRYVWSLKGKRNNTL